MRRIFIGIKTEFPPDFTDKYSQIQRLFKTEKIAWETPDNFHITICFPGRVSDEIAENIKNDLPGLVKDIGAFDVTYKTTGIFKNLHIPRILWIGVENNKTLQQLRDLTNNLANSYDICVDDFSFTPHVTIGRLKWVDQQTRLNRYLSQYSEEIFGTQHISQITVFESSGTARNKCYKELSTIALK